MPTNTEIEQLREFCIQDIKVTLPNLTRILGQASPEDALEFVMQLRPVLVVSRDKLIEFKGSDVVRLNLRQTLADSPLEKGWMAIRRGELGSEDLPQIHDDLQTYARPYAEAVMGLFEKVATHGYKGFIHCLKKNGYTADMFSQTFTGIRQLAQDLGLGHIKNAADIRKAYQGESPTLLTPDQMFGYIAGNFNFPEGLTKKVYEQYPSNRATTSGLANIKDNGDAEFRIIMVTGLEPAERTLVHEYAHIFYALQKAKEGKIPSTIASTGATETYAKIIGGIDQGEAVFFASCMEASYNFATYADRILSSRVTESTKLERLTKAIANPASFLTSETGFSSVPSSIVVPFGPYSAAYLYDGIKGALLRPQIERQGITDPLEIYKLVS